MAYAYPDGRQVLFGVDLTVHEGERVAILGPNGAGKTTLVLHLNGTLQAGAGRVSVDGLPVVKEHLKEIRRRVGIVFQDPDDQLFMPTVRDDVAFGPANLGYRGPELAERVARALRAVGCEDLADRPPHHLSFGQRRRVAAATVLSMDPRVLVLDEPSSNLDPMARREFAEIVLSLGLTTLMVTHDLPYALQLCPRAVVLTDGVIVADGPTREILADEALMRANRLELPFGFALPEETPAGPGDSRAQRTSSSFFADDLPGVLVVAQAEEARVAHDALVGPLGELDLGDQLGPHPVGPLWRSCTRVGGGSKGHAGMARAASSALSARRTSR